MAKLTEEEKEELRAFTRRGYVQSPQERSPIQVELTPEGRLRYARWATEMCKFYKGKQPVRFIGDQWKL